MADHATLAGVEFAIKGQNAAAGDLAGGDLALYSGAKSGIGDDGAIVLYTGTGPVEIARFDDNGSSHLQLKGAGVLDSDTGGIDIKAASAQELGLFIDAAEKINISSTLTTSSQDIQLSGAATRKLRFHAASTTANIEFDAITSGTSNAHHMVVQGQDAFEGAGGNLTLNAGDGGTDTATNRDGGDLVLNAGAKAASGADGAVDVQVAGASRIKADGTGLGFFTATATPVVQQTASSALTKPTGSSDAGTSLTNEAADYGGIWVNANGASLTLTTSGSWYQFVAFDTNGVSRGATPDHTNDHITVGTTGDYEITAHISFTGGSTNNTYEWAVQVDGDISGTGVFGNLMARRAIGTASLAGSATIVSQVTLTAGETVELWARCTTTSSTSITGIHVALAIKQIDMDPDDNIAALVKQGNENRLPMVNLGLTA